VCEGLAHTSVSLVRAPVSTWVLSCSTLACTPASSCSAAKRPLSSLLQRCCVSASRSSAATSRCAKRSRSRLAESASCCRIYNRHGYPAGERAEGCGCGCVCVDACTYHNSRNTLFQDLFSLRCLCLQHRGIAVQGRCLLVGTAECVWGGGGPPGERAGSRAGGGWGPPGEGGGGGAFRAPSSRGRQMGKYWVAQ